MPRNLRANVELTVNTVIAIAVVVIAGVAVKRYVTSEQTNSQSLPEHKRLLMGTRVIVPNVNWGNSRNHLVFFLDKNCAYCTSSAPFYRQLLEEAAKRDVQWLAILQNAPDEAREYVRSLSLPIENVQSGTLASYKIPGVPTVMLLDEGGVVKGVWLGAHKGREKEMQAELLALLDAAKGSK